MKQNKTENKRSERGKSRKADLSKARETVDRIRHADAPRVSTTTKGSAVGVPSGDFKPRQKSPKTTEPPVPRPRK